MSISANISADILLLFLKTILRFYYLFFAVTTLVKKDYVLTLKKYYYDFHFVQCFIKVLVHVKGLES